MKLFLDITRIATRMFRSAPTGIDRVEFAYAAEIFQKPQPFTPVGILTTPLFTGAIDRSRVLDLLQRVENAWAQNERAGADPVFKSVRDLLESPKISTATRTVRLQGKSTFRLVKNNLDLFSIRDILRAAPLLTQTLKQGDRQNSVFLHTSHTLLERNKSFEWLAKHSVKSAFLIHDAIPIDYPEYCRPGALEKHRARLKSVAEYASLIIANSNFSANAVARHMRDQGQKIPEIATVALGVADNFLSDRLHTPPNTRIPYFVCVGTIEPRKNITFLLTIWRKLVQRLGAATPRLVIVGRRGWENESVIDVFERSSFMAPHLIEVSDLSDSGLASLLRGAVALVAPSLVEGFGLPVAESLALGVPVLASDIAAHREAGGEFAHYIDPLDGPAWIAAIEALTDSNSTLRAETLEHIKRYKPTLWTDHVKQSLLLLQDM